jgi:hypothetical protein
MKCHFCNWDNPEGRTKCEKCDHDLQPDMAESSSYEHDRPTTRKPAKSVSNDLKKTINENEFKRMRENLNETVPEERNMCPECHHELEDGECPSCGYKKSDKANEQKQGNNMKVNKNKETQRWDPKAEVAKGRFVLTPLSGKTRMPENDPISYAGNEIELNRENTDPANSTITSKTQAIVTYDDGKWSISDESELRSTFVQAARKIELQNGDLILLGNQLYRFDSITE